MYCVKNQILGKFVKNALFVVYDVTTFFYLRISYREIYMEPETTKKYSVTSLDDKIFIRWFNYSRRSRPNRFGTFYVCPNKYFEESINRFHPYLLINQHFKCTQLVKGISTCKYCLPHEYKPQMHLGQHRVWKIYDFQRWIFSGFFHRPRGS